MTSGICGFHGHNRQGCPHRTTETNLTPKQTRGKFGSSKHGSFASQGQSQESCQTALNIVPKNTKGRENTMTTEKRKRFEGIGIYTNLSTGEQVWNGPGLRWKGKKSMTSKKLQEQRDVIVTKQRKNKVETSSSRLEIESSQVAPSNAEQ